MSDLIKTRYADADHAAFYKKYRPKPDPQILGKIMDYLKEKKTTPLNAAVDAACGSGQSTEMLSPHFKTVLGIDISEPQIVEARKSNTIHNVSYSVGDVLHIPVATNSVDLVTCSQAAHWLDFPAFCSEADRILTPNGCLAVFIFEPAAFFYDDTTISERLTELYHNLIHKTFRPYMERDVWNLYYSGLKEFSIPYPKWQRQSFAVEEEISVSTLFGCIQSMSMYRRFNQKNPGNDLLQSFQSRFLELMGADTLTNNITIQKDVTLLLGRKPCHE